MTTMYFLFFLNRWSYLFLILINILKTTPDPNPNLLDTTSFRVDLY